MDQTKFKDPVTIKISVAKKNRNNANEVCLALVFHLRKGMRKSRELIITKKFTCFFYRKEKLIFIIVVPRVYAVNRDEVLAKFTNTKHCLAQPSERVSLDLR